MRGDKGGPINPVVRLPIWRRGLGRGVGNAVPAAARSANSTAYAFGGDSNIAYVSDPFGAAGSPDSAVAGDGFRNDLAEVLFAHGNATADTANLLYDIVSLFGNTAGSF